MNYRNEKIQLLELIDEINELPNVTTSIDFHKSDYGQSCNILISIKNGDLNMSKHINMYLCDKIGFRTLSFAQGVKELQNIINQNKPSTTRRFLNKIGL